MTFHLGHGDFAVHLLSVAQLYEQGKIDYSCYCCEISRAGVLHLQGFVIFNEVALENGQKPTDHLGGSWQKARSLTGARDYIAREGIHYAKGGLLGSYEFGEWVDAGYNINIKFRKQYQFSRMLEDNISPAEIAAHDPAGVLLVGLKNLQDLYIHVRGGKKPVLPNAPYYYIGREQFELVLATDELFWQGFQTEEE